MHNFKLSPMIGVKQNSNELSPLNWIHNQSKIWYVVCESTHEKRDVFKWDEKSHCNEEERIKHNYFAIPN